MDAVVTVVDGPAVAASQFAANPQAVAVQRAEDPNLDHSSSLHELFEDQLSAADLVVLNKVDLMGDAQRSRVMEQIHREIADQVKVVQAQHGRLELEIMLGLDRAAEDFIHLRHDHHGGHHDASGNHSHDHDAFDSVVIDLPEAPGERMLGLLQALVKEKTVYRVKGFVAVPGKPMRQVIQGVGSRFDCYYDRRWQLGESRRTRIVMIGRELDQRALQTRLEQGLIAAA